MGRDYDGEMENMNFNVSLSMKSKTTPDLCLPIGDEVNDDDDDSCSAAERAASGAQYRRAFWLFLGQAFCGIGSSGYFALGISHMDDGVPKSSSSLHVGKYDNTDSIIALNYVQKVDHELDRCKNHELKKHT